MNKILEQKTRALDAAVWPLGRPEKAYEIPMWQSICRDWVRDKMRPANVTYLIDELLKVTDCDDPETTAYDIHKAEDAAANWEECARRAGWVDCDSVIEELAGDDPVESGRLLLKLVNLALQGFSDVANFKDDHDYAFYWIRKTPAWDGDNVATESEMVEWADMTDTYIEHRVASDLRVERSTGDAVEYQLGYCRVGHPTLYFPDKAGVSKEILDSRKIADLPDGYFLPLSKMVENCRHAVTAWIISEWLEPHGFVNFELDDWSSETTWQKLGEQFDLEDEVTREEVSQWFIVNEFAAEALREVGAVVADLVGTEDCLFGRIEGGQVLHFDGIVQRAMIYSGYLDRVPPLGALNREREVLPRIRITLGGEEFPFRIYGYSEHRPDRELDGVILDPVYREAGWCVIWGPSFESEAEGMVRKFKLSPVTPVDHPEPEYHEG